jgi:hypothetical protein
MANQSVLLCTAENQSIAAGAAGKSILAVASFMANQSVPLYVAANQSIAAGAAGKSFMEVASSVANQSVQLCEAAHQSIATVHRVRQVDHSRWFPHLKRLS